MPRDTASHKSANQQRPKPCRPLVISFLYETMTRGGKPVKGQWSLAYDLSDFKGELSNAV